MFRDHGSTNKKVYHEYSQIKSAAPSIFKKIFTGISKNKREEKRKTVKKQHNTLDKNHYHI